jgi:hypothetical protein
MIHKMELASKLLCILVFHSILPVHGEERKCLSGNCTDGIGELIIQYESYTHKFKGNFKNGDPLEGYIIYESTVGEKVRYILEFYLGEKNIILNKIQIFDSDKLWIEGKGKDRKNILGDNLITIETKIYKLDQTTLFEGTLTTNKDFIITNGFGYFYDNNTKRFEDKLSRTQLKSISYRCIEGNCISGKSKLVGLDGSLFIGLFSNGDFLEGQKHFKEYIYEGFFKDNYLIKGKVTKKNGHLISVGKYEKGYLVEGIEYAYDGKVLSEGKYDNGFLVEGIKYGYDDKILSEGKYEKWNLKEGTRYLDNGIELYVNEQKERLKYNQRWIFIGETSVKGYWFYDEKTIQKEFNLKSKLVSFNIWIKEIFDSEGINENKYNYQINCLEKTYSDYQNKNRLLIPPESMVELIYYNHCK